MGCKSANQIYIEKISKLSQGQVDVVQIETIIINTLFDERDIYKLYIKFQKLEPNEEGLISNTQLLELPEFKYCPFRNHLLRVFKLISTEPNEEGEKDEDELQSDDDKVNSSKRNSIKVYVKNKQKNNNFIGSIDKSNIKLKYFRLFHK